MFNYECKDSNLLKTGNYRIYLHENKVILTHLDTNKCVIFNKENNKITQINSLSEENELQEKIDVR